MLSRPGCYTKSLLLAVLTAWFFAGVETTRLTAAEPAPWKRWAMLTGREIGYTAGEELEKRIRQQRETEWVSTDETDAIVAALPVSRLLGADGCVSRRKLAARLKADALVFVTHSIVGDTRQVVVTVCDGKTGLTIEADVCGVATDSPELLAAAFEKFVTGVHARFASGAWRAVSVARDVKDQNPAERRLPAAWGKLVEASARLRPQVAVIDPVEAVAYQAAPAPNQAVETVTVSAGELPENSNADYEQTTNAARQLLARVHRLDANSNAVATLITATEARLRAESQASLPWVASADAYSSPKRPSLELGTPAEALLLLQPLDVEVRSQLIALHRLYTLRRTEAHMSHSTPRVLPEFADLIAPHQARLRHLEFLIRKRLISVQLAIQLATELQTTSPANYFLTGTFVPPAVFDYSQFNRTALSCAAAEAKFFGEVFPLALELHTDPQRVANPSEQALLDSWQSVQLAAGRVGLWQATSLDLSDLQTMERLLKTFPQSVRPDSKMLEFFERAELTLGFAPTSMRTALPRGTPLGSTPITTAAYVDFLKRLAASENPTVRLYAKVGIVRRRWLPVMAGAEDKLLGLSAATARGALEEAKTLCPPESLFLKKLEPIVADLDFRAARQAVAEGAKPAGPTEQPPAGTPATLPPEAVLYVPDLPDLPPAGAPPRGRSAARIGRPLPFGAFPRAGQHAAIPVLSPGELPGGNQPQLRDHLGDENRPRGRPRVNQQPFRASRVFAG